MTDTKDIVTPESETKRVVQPKRSMIRNLLCGIAVVLTVGLVYMSAGVSFAGYKYGKVEGYTLDVISMPQTKKTRSFLSYVKEVLSDKKMSNWEYRQIQTKYEKLTEPKTKS